MQFLVISKHLKFKNKGDNNKINKNIYIKYKIKYNLSLKTNRP
jgi:hypothetical protein